MANRLSERQRLAIFRKFGKNDVIFLFLLAAVLVAAFAIFLWMNAGKSGGIIQITINGKLYGTYSLKKEQEIKILDKNGKVTNILRIRGGKAKMISADCPDGLCVHQSAISRANENIVCLPNRIVVTVERNAEENNTGSSGIDAIAQ